MGYTQGTASASHICDRYGMGGREYSMGCWIRGKGALAEGGGLFVYRHTGVWLW